MIQHKLFLILQEYIWTRTWEYNIVLKTPAVTYFKRNLYISIYIQALCMRETKALAILKCWTVYLCAHWKHLETRSMSTMTMLLWEMSTNCASVHTLLPQFFYSVVLLYLIADELHFVGTCLVIWTKMNYKHKFSKKVCHLSTHN